jgi:hypothetical protein
MSLAALQKKIGVTADGAWGPGTLRAAAAYYKLSPTRAAHFFGQTAHETGGFKAFTENLNYGAKGLQQIPLLYNMSASQKESQIEFMHHAWVMDQKHQVMVGSIVVAVHYN